MSYGLFTQVVDGKCTFVEAEPEQVIKYLRHIEEGTVPKKSEIPYTKQKGPKAFTKIPKCGPNSYYIEEFDRLNHLEPVSFVFSKNKEIPQ